jgi:aldehyde dehydrogenase (NAD+)
MCSFEARLFETDPIIAHVNEALAHVASATASEHLPVPLALGTASARVDVVPKGAVLIIGAWNYPAQLTIAPMIDALAAGNTVVVKPSEVSPHSANALAHLLGTYFTDGSVTVVQAAKEGTTRLLEKRWDHIIYTGNSFVGRIVMKAAAEHLTPVTLELGGKCPAIVDPSANFAVACKRIVQARFANAGQTCLAVDYVLVHDSVHDKFVDVLTSTIEACYTASPQECADYGRIINERHTRRIAATIEDAKKKGAKIVAGGDYEVADCYIAPTVITDAPAECTVQLEETFGPLLLVQRVKDTDAAIARVNSGEKPLSLYIFSETAVSHSNPIAQSPAAPPCGHRSLNRVPAAVSQTCVVSPCLFGIRSMRVRSRPLLRSSARHSPDPWRSMMPWCKRASLGRRLVALASPEWAPTAA